MLFDLKGRRRRVVQGTYLMLAVLMGGGLVLFGIGGDVSGGLFDAFSDRSQDRGGNPIAERRVESAERRLRANPDDRAALKDLARGSFQLAGDDIDRRTNTYTPEGRTDLARAARAWERYVKLERRPDPSLARLMLQVYSENGLRRFDQAAAAAEIVAEADPSPAAYLLLARYARFAKQDRKAELAGRQAVELAPKREKKTVREQLASIEAEVAQQQGATAQGGAGGGAAQP